jgi:DnaJ-class molecular chaperone
VDGREPLNIARYLLDKCEACDDGTAYAEDGFPEACDECFGAGVLTARIRVLVLPRECGECDGRGYLVDAGAHDCENCDHDPCRDCDDGTLAPLPEVIASLWAQCVEAGVALEVSDVS